MNNFIKIIELKNNLSNKLFTYTLDEFNQYFHDEILTVQFKIVNFGYFKPIRQVDGSFSTPDLKLVLDSWDELSARHKRVENNKPLYQLVSYS